MLDVTAQHDNDKKKFLLATIISFSHILSIISEVDFKRPSSSATRCLRTLWTLEQATKVFPLFPKFDALGVKSMCFVSVPVLRIKISPLKKRIPGVQFVVKHAGFKVECYRRGICMMLLLCCALRTHREHRRIFWPKLSKCMKRGDMCGFLFTQIPFHVNSIFTKIVPVEKKETTRSFMKCESED